MTDIDEDKVETLLRGAGKRTPLPEDVQDRLEQSFRSELAATRRKRQITRLGAIGLVASLFISVLVIFNGPGDLPRMEVASVSRDKGESTWSFEGTSGPLKAGNIIAAGDSIKTEDGAVSLNPTGTDVDVRIAQYSEVVFVDATTIQLHHGSVYVDSQSTAPHYPLQVITNGISVMHIGTQYMITHTSDRIEIAVREGEVIIDHGNEPIHSRGADGNGELTLFTTGEAYQQFSIDIHDERWTWASELSPEIETDNMPIAEFLDWISRETGFSIVYVDVRLSDVDRIKGSTATSNAMRALDEAMSITPFAAEIDRTLGTIRVSPKTARSDRYL